MKPFCVSENIFVSVHDATTLLIKTNLPDFNFNSAITLKTTSETKWTKLPLLNRKGPENYQFVRFFSSIEKRGPGIRIEIGFNLHKPSIEEFGDYAPQFEIIVNDNTLELETEDIDDELADTDPECHDMSDIKLCGSIELTLDELMKWVNHDDLLWVTCKLGDDDDEDDMFEYETETRVSFLHGAASVGIKNFFATKSFDIHFVVGPHEIGSHRCLLPMYSNLFPTETSDKIIIEDASLDGVQEFVNILNTFEATFSPDNPVMTFEVKGLAKRYGIEYIEKAAIDMYNISQLNENNFVELFK